MNYIPYGKQSINEDDILEINKILTSDWLTQGPTIERFEKAVATYCGASFGVAVSSATAALHIACLALGLKPGDSLWTSPNTFVASANCALYCGANVDFVDIDGKTYNIDCDRLEEKLIEAKKTGRLPKIVIPVHFAGQSCDMARIKKLSEAFGFKIIEDASHAIGGSYQDHKIGDCRYADITVFSFHPVKLITTGEGGMLLTNQKPLYEALMRLRTHGITRDTNQMEGEVAGPWYYEQIDLGFNYRMTDIQAGLGLSQLKKLDHFIEKRRQLVANYNRALASVPVITPYEAPDRLSAWHLYVVLLDETKTKKTRREVFDVMRNKNIGVNVHYIPVHQQPYFQKKGFSGRQFQTAESYYARTITLPLHPSLTDEELAYVVNTLQEALS